MTKQYKVRGANGDKTIRVPDEVWGEYTFEMHDDGSFTFRPAEGQIVSPQKKVQWIVTTPELEDAVIFTNEKSAVEYKELMERNQGKVFRMKKVFPSKGIQTLGEMVF